MIINLSYPDLRIDPILIGAFVKRSYLLDVALDELRGGHLLGRQTLLQLQLVRWADWLAPLHPADTTERCRGWEGRRTKIVSLSLSQHSAKPQDAPKAPEALTYRFRKLLKMYELTVTGPPVTRCYSQPSDLYYKNNPHHSPSTHRTALRIIVDACCCPVGGGREIQ